jgi:MoaA/NifB/PqqE/SkfB family radical SAM enzyme
MVSLKTMDKLTINYLDGWYGKENDRVADFRWMRKQASCTLKNISSPGKKVLKIAAGHSFEKVPVLEVFANGRKLGEKGIKGPFASYYFTFEDEQDVHIDLRLDQVFQIPSDIRELGLMVRELEVLNLSELDAPLFENGWQEWEYQEFFPFRWMSREARLFVPLQKFQTNRYAGFNIFSEMADFSQKLSVFSRGLRLAEVPLLYKWNYYTIPLHPSRNTAENETGISPTGDETELIFLLNKLIPEKYHPADRRELGVRVGELEFHNDEERHQKFVFFHNNALLNYQEAQEGKTKLDSFPTNLGIDLFGKCNIRPHCVYCLWDRMKELEGDCADVVVDEKTLAAYGPFITSARTLVNCSFGEPLLHPRFQEILDFCARNKKIVELSTNGQAFTPRTVKALAGKPVTLYISLDAATKETYAKIRNDRWDSILPNLLLLNEERKKKGNLPKIFMVFMPMRVNKDELEEYFRLCRTIDADALVLRPLLYLWKPEIREDRGGYLFDYEKELLSREEAEEIFKKCDELSRKYQISVANQYTFGMTPEPGKENKAAIF